MRIARVLCFFTPPPSKKRKKKKGDGSFFPIFSGKDLVFLTFSSIFVPTIKNCKKSHNYAPKTKNS